MAATGTEPLSVSGLNAVLGASSSVPDGDRPVSVDNLKAVWDSYQAKNGPAALTAESYMTGWGGSSVAHPSWLSTVGFSSYGAGRYFDSGTNIYGTTVNAIALMNGTYDLSVTVTLVPPSNTVLWGYRLSVSIGGQQYVDERSLESIPDRTKVVTYETSLAITSGTVVSIMGGGCALNSSLDTNKISVSLVKR